jgi:hypothetical protein
MNSMPEKASDRTTLNGCLPFLLARAYCSANPPSSAPHCLQECHRRLGARERPYRLDLADTISSGTLPWIFCGVTPRSGIGRQTD